MYFINILAYKYPVLTVSEDGKSRKAILTHKLTDSGAGNLCYFSYINKTVERVVNRNRYPFGAFYHNEMNLTINMDSIFSTCTSSSYQTYNVVFL